MLLDAYTTDSTPASDESVDRVLRVLSAFPVESKNEIEEEEEEPPIDQCSKVASAAVKWLKKVAGLAYAPQIYGNVASYITKCLGWMGLGIAMPHYARSNDFSSFASAVAAAADEGQPGEEDLFIARAVLSTASTVPSPTLPGTPAVTSLKRAREFLSIYPTAAGHAVPSTPLTHFLDLYLEALEKKSSPLVDILVDKYKITLERDPSLWDLIEKSRSIFAPAPVAPMPGLFGDLFRSMMMPGS
jgi:golgi to ER traffic protein 4